MTGSVYLWPLCFAHFWGMRVVGYSSGESFDSAAKLAIFGLLQLHKGHLVASNWPLPAEGKNYRTIPIRVRVLEEKNNNALEEVVACVKATPPFLALP